MKSSKRPLILIGNGARYASYLPFFINLCESKRIPILLTHNSLDLLAYNREINLGFPGIFGNRYSNLVAQSSDLIIALGARLSLSQTGYNKNDFGRNAKIVLIDIDKYELKKKNVKIYIGIKKDVNKFIIFLIKSIGKFKSIDNQWLSRANKIKHEYSVIKEKHDINEKYVNSYYFIDWLSNNTFESSNFCTDMGLSYQSTYQAIKLKNNSRLITNTNFASMGWGICAAIGISLGSSRKKTILLTGDGGLMMNLQELATIKKHELPIKIFVYNNKGYLTMRQSQELGGRITGSDENTGLFFPDWSLIAQSFCLDYLYISNNKNLDGILIEALTNKKPVLIDLNMSLDQAQIPKAINTKKDIQGFSQSLLENPFPFITQEELTSVMGYLINE